MMREIVVDGDAAGDAQTSSRRLTPANARRPSAIRSGLMPTSVATAIAAVALRTL